MVMQVTTNHHDRTGLIKHESAESTRARNLQASVHTLTPYSMARGGGVAARRLVGVAGALSLRSRSAEGCGAALGGSSRRRTSRPSRPYAAAAARSQ